MKILTTILLGITLFASCSKSLESNQSNPLEEHSAYNQKSLSYHYEYRCTGSCSSGPESCSMSLSLATNIVACCGGCALEIEVIQGSYDPNDSAKTDLFPIELEDYLQTRFSLGVEDVRFLHFSVIGNGDSHFVSYDIRVNGNDHNFAIMRASGKTYTVNCDGTCDCRSQFHLGSGMASCSCSECTLTVQVTE